ncbi:MAG TPA: hypothetical protein VNS46_14395 [Nocardioides sp.]|nr:hypothetical protein [Nocardioides sp.]
MNAGPHGHSEPVLNKARSPRGQSGDTAGTALEALPEALGRDWATLLREAMQTLGPAYPADGDARSSVLDARDLDDAMHSFDSQYLELEGSTDADRLVDAYLSAGF